MSHERYKYYQHGLLFIVYQNVPAAFGTTIYDEDSRWESEEKAKEHCKILNENERTTTE